MNLMPETTDKPVRLNDGANCFDLRIAGYQFPSNTKCPSDSNWVLLAIRARDAHRAVERIDPCMTVQETHGLSAWLQHVASGHMPPHELTFLEPNLTFCWEDAPDPDETNITVTISDTLHPQWPAKGDPEFREKAARCNNNPWQIELKCSRGLMLDAAYALAAQLRRFPVRGGAK